MVSLVLVLCTQVRIKVGSQYDASQRVIHLKPVQNCSQLTHDDAHPFAPQRLNRNLFCSCVRVATRHSVNPPLACKDAI